MTNHPLTNARGMAQENPAPLPTHIQFHETTPRSARCLRQEQFFPIAPDERNMPLPPTMSQASLQHPTFTIMGPLQPHYQPQTRSNATTTLQSQSIQPQPSSMQSQNEENQIPTLLPHSRTGLNNSEEVVVMTMSSLWIPMTTMMIFPHSTEVDQTPTHSPGVAMNCRIPIQIPTTIQGIPWTWTTTKTTHQLTTPASLRPHSLQVNNSRPS